MSTVVKRTIKGGGGYLVTNLTVKSLGFAFVWAASRLLGSEAFGVLALALSVEGLATSLAGLGLPVTVQHFLSGAGKKDSHLIYGSACLLAAIGGLVGATVLYVFAPHLASTVFSDPELVAPLRILGIAVFLAVPYNLGKSVLQAQEKVKEYGILEVVRAAFKLLLVIALAALSETVVGAAWAIPVSFGAGLVVAVRYLRRLDLQPVIASIRVQSSRVLRYSLPLVVVGFSYFMAQQADRLMLGIFASSSDVGVYTVVSTLALATTVVHKSLITVFMPVASQAYRGNQYKNLRTSYLVVGKWAAVVNAVGLLLFVGAGHFILQLFGPDYVSTPAYVALVVLASLYFLGAWVGPTGAVLQMSDGQYVELFNTIVFIVMNIGLNVLLIPPFGIIGAAMATFASGIVRNGLQFWEIRSRLSFYPVDATNFGFLLLTGSGLVLGLWLREQVLLQLLSIGIVLLVLGGYVVISLKQSERELLSRVFQRAVGVYRSMQ